MNNLFYLGLEDYIKSIEANNVVLSEAFKNFELKDSVKVYDLGNAVLECEYYETGGRIERRNYFQIYVKNPETESVSYAWKDLNLKGGFYSMAILCDHSVITVLLRDFKKNETVKNASIELNDDGSCYLYRFSNGFPVETVSVSLDDVISALGDGDYSAFVTCDFSRGNTKK